MTTKEFKEQNLINYLKNNLIFIGQYTGPLNFYKIDRDYAILFGDYKAAYNVFSKAIQALDSVQDDPSLSEEILVKAYYQACNGFYNNIFHSSGHPVSLSDTLEILDRLDDKNTIYWHLFKYLLEIKYHKAFMVLKAFGPSWSDYYAIILCPTDTSESVLKQVATICWDYPVAFDRFNSYNKE